MIIDERMDVFQSESRIMIDGKLYVVCRHFVSKRDFTDAVYAVVQNDAKRNPLGIFGV